MHMTVTCICVCTYVCMDIQVRPTSQSPAGALPATISSRGLIIEVPESSLFPSLVSLFPSLVPRFVLSHASPHLLPFSRLSPALFSPYPFPVPSLFSPLFFHCSPLSYFSRVSREVFPSSISHHTCLSLSHLSAPSYFLSRSCVPRVPNQTFSSFSSFSSFQLKHFLWPWQVLEEVLGQQSSPVVNPARNRTRSPSPSTSSVVSSSEAETDKSRNKSRNRQVSTLACI